MVVADFFSPHALGDAVTGGRGQFKDEREDLKYEMPSYWLAIGSNFHLSKSWFIIGDRLLRTNTEQKAPVFFCFFVCLSKEFINVTYVLPCCAESRGIELLNLTPYPSYPFAPVRSKHFGGNYWELISSLEFFNFCKYSLNIQK